MRGRLGPQINVFAIQGMCNAVDTHVAHDEGKPVPGSSPARAGTGETHGKAGGGGEVWRLQRVQRLTLRHPQRPAWEAWWYITYNGGRRNPAKLNFCPVDAC